MSATDQEPCRWCGALHDKICPHVKALEFDPTTLQVVRVEFVTAADFPPTIVAPGDHPPGYETLGPKGPLK